MKIWAISTKLMPHDVQQSLNHPMKFGKDVISEYSLHYLWHPGILLLPLSLLEVVFGNPTIIGGHPYLINSCKDI